MKLRLTPPSEFGRPIEMTFELFLVDSLRNGGTSHLHPLICAVSFLVERERPSQLVMEELINKMACRLEMARYKVEILS